MLPSYIEAFKAYDIRWLYGRQIDEQFCFILWHAVWSRQLQMHAFPQILLWWDSRPANNSLIYCFLGWLRYAGIDEVTILNLPTKEKGIECKWWVASTSVMYYCTQNTFDLWISFTASHNTKEYVWIKMCDKNVTLTDTSFLKALFELSYTKLFTVDIPKSLDWLSINYHDTIFDSLSSLSAFLHRVNQLVSSDFSFAVDYCHGATTWYERDFLSSIPTKKIIHINGYPDGTFPVHDSETQHSHNYHQVIDAINDHSLDFGIMFDWDGDRIGFVTQQWRIMPWDMVWSIIASYLLQQPYHEKNPIVLYDIMSSKNIERIVWRLWWKTIVTRVGRYFINSQLRDHNGLFASECSAHYLFGSLGWYEMPLYALIIMMHMAKKYWWFDALYDAYSPISIKSPVYDVSVKEKDHVLDTMRNYFSSHPIVMIDGVNIMADSFRVTVRASNTSDKIRYCIEADTQEEYDILLTTIQKILDQFK